MENDVENALSRRTVIGAAWAAPVVPLAVAAPGASASPEPPLPPVVDSIVITEVPGGDAGFRIDVVGENLYEGLFGRFETNDPFLDPPDGGFQLRSNESTSAFTTLYLSGNNTWGVDVDCRIDVTVAGVTRSLDYVHEPI